MGLEKFLKKFVIIKIKLFSFLLTGTYVPKTLGSTRIPNLIIYTSLSQQHRTIFRLSLIIRVDFRNILKGLIRIRICNTAGSVPTSTYRSFYIDPGILKYLIL
jgi:hypothetical protein